MQNNFSQEIPNQTEWNLNQFKIQIIGEHLIKATDFWAREFYTRSFKHYKAIRSVAMSKFSEDEIKKCRSMEVNIKRQIKIIDGIIKQVYPTNRFEIELDKYVEYLNSLLTKYGLDLSTKEDTGLF
jgi:hypothetical protein